MNDPDNSSREELPYTIKSEEGNTETLKLLFEFLPVPFFILKDDLTILD